RIVNLCPDHIRREHVRRKLQAREFYIQAVCQGLDREGFGKARHAFEENMAIGKQTNDQSFDQIGLPDDDLPNLVEKRSNKSAGLLNSIINSTDSCIH